MNDATGLLIITDLDGTLLDGDGKVPRSNLEAIERFKAAGGRFTIASGRYGKKINALFPDYAKKVNAPTVYSNGAVIYDEVNDRPISEVTGEVAAMLEPMAAVKATFPEMEITPVVMRDGSLVRQWVEEVTEDKCYYKILFHGDIELLERARAFVDAHFRGMWHMSLSCPSLLELVVPDATKGAALGRLREYYSERGEKPFVFGVGDYENDADMLMAADVAACPANAIDSVKTIAKVLLCDHNDGCIADLVSRILDTNELDSLIKGDK